MTSRDDEPGSGRSRLPKVLRALRHRPFALLWLGQTVSRIGDFLYHLTLAWWVLEKTGSALDQLGSCALMPVGFAVAGWATDLLGAPMVLALGGLGTVVLSALVLMLPAIRRFDPVAAP